MSNYKIDFDTQPPIAPNEYDSTIEMALPGYTAMQTIILACLKSRLGEKANLLIVGAGTGNELLKLGQRNPEWKLLGVDPSANMLSIAKQKIEQNGLSDRISLIQGYVEDLPQNPLYNAATSVLVMHFLPDDGSKLNYLQSIAQRLEKSASFVLVDVFGDKKSPEFEEIIRFVAAYRSDMGMPIEKHLESMENFNKGVHPVSEARELELLQEAGFGNVMRFYTGLCVGGWIATNETIK